MSKARLAGRAPVACAVPGPGQPCSRLYGVRRTAEGSWPTGWPLRPLAMVYRAAQRLQFLSSHLTATTTQHAAAPQPEILPGVSLTTFEGGEHSRAPFEEMAACVSRSFVSYEPSLWTYGFPPDGACDATVIAWTLARTMRLMGTIEGATAYVCRDSFGQVISSVYLLENVAGGQLARSKVSDEDRARAGLTRAAQIGKMGSAALARAALFGKATSAARTEDTANWGRHLYVGMFGAAPERRGQGLGTAVLRLLTAEADRRGLPMFLYTANMRNVRFYQREGDFVLCNQRALPAGGQHAGPFPARVFSLQRKPQRG